MSSHASDWAGCNAVKSCMHEFCGSQGTQCRCEHNPLVLPPSVSGTKEKGRKRKDSPQGQISRYTTGAS